MNRCKLARLAETGVLAETGFDVRSRRRNRPLTGLATCKLQDLGSLRSLTSCADVGLQNPRRLGIADTPKYRLGHTRRRPNEPFLRLQNPILQPNIQRVLTRIMLS